MDRLTQHQVAVESLHDVEAQVAFLRVSSYLLAKANAIQACHATLIGCL